MKKMKFLKINILQLLLLLPAILFFSCDPEGEENIDWRAGDNLMIAGPASISTLSTSSYFVRGFTTDKTYAWTLEGPSGAGEVVVSRGGEYADIFVEAPGEYALTVTNGTHSETLTIEAESENQVLGFETDSVTVSEVASDMLYIPVVIDSRNMSETVVSFSVAGGTAEEGVDYHVVTQSPLTFKSGVTRDTIEVHLVSDMLREANETIILSLGEISATGAGEYATTLYTKAKPTDPNLASIVVTIEDDVKFVAFEEVIMDTLRSAASAGNYVFNVTLSEPADGDVTIPYTVTGVGVTPTTGTVTFPSSTTPQDWSVSQPLTINISEEAFVANQTITITLGEPVSDDEEVEFQTGEDGAVVGNTTEVFIKLDE